MAAVALGGCALYKPAPLPGGAEPHFADLTVDRSTLPFPQLAHHPFNAANGLDGTEVAMLAVANNPALKLARDDAGVSHAQAFAAGLLPNPTVSYGMDFPQHTPGATTAYNAGIGLDLNALVTHAAQRHAAQADARSTDLNLLWQEWQVITQARLLTARILSQEKLLQWLGQNRDLLAARGQAASAALHEGNLAADGANAALLAAQDAERQDNEQRRQLQQTRADLNALLGLAPETALRLIDDDNPTQQPADADITAALKRLPQRPDLLALRAGYAAQDARYRQAILAQFPPFNLSVNKARDNTGTPSLGFAINFTLPIFDHNQGNVAIQQATRQRLYDEYQFRLNSAYEDVARLQADIRLEAAQLQGLDISLPALDASASRASEALSQGDIDGPGYASFVSADLQKHVERETLASALSEQRLALLMLLGGDFPDTAKEINP